MACLNQGFSSAQAEWDLATLQTCLQSPENFHSRYIYVLNHGAPQGPAEGKTLFPDLGLPFCSHSNDDSRPGRTLSGGVLGNDLWAEVVSASSYPALSIYPKELITYLHEGPCAQLLLHLFSTVSIYF